MLTARRPLRANSSLACGPRRWTGASRSPGHVRGHRCCPHGRGRRISSSHSSHTPPSHHHCWTSHAAHAPAISAHAHPCHSHARSNSPHHCIHPHVAGHHWVHASAKTLGSSVAKL